MIKTILIDDEPLARSIILEYLQDKSDFQVVAECNDGFEGLKSIQEHKPDLIFLDIQMPRINGFEMLELLENPPGVIFTTAFDEYALKAFETHAIDYLLKPFTKERLETALSKWKKSAAPAEQHGHEEVLESMAASPGQKDRIVVKIGNKIKIIPVKDIEYFEADDDYVSIHAGSDSFLKNRTMNYFEKLLNSSEFVRVHRSFIVHVPEITRIDPYHKDSYIAILKSGVKIPVSRSGYTRLREILGL
jgi:two-component system LytT family response regulator